MSVILETAYYNGKQVRIDYSYISKNSSYLTIINDDGTRELVRKDALLFNFGTSYSHDWDNYMAYIEKKDKEIEEGQAELKNYTKLYNDQKDIMVAKRKEKHSILSHAGVSSVEDLNQADAVKFYQLEGEQSAARRGMNRALADILYTTHNVVSEILSNGKNKLMAIAMRGVAGLFN